MRIVFAEIGADVGALVVEELGERVVVIDPGLSLREQFHAVAEILDDAEFRQVAPVLFRPVAV